MALSRARVDALGSAEPVSLTLVSDSPVAVYSGMVPGVRDLTPRDCQAD